MVETYKSVHPENIPFKISPRTQGSILKGFFYLKTLETL